MKIIILLYEMVASKSRVGNKQKGGRVTERSRLRERDRAWERTKKWRVLEMTIGNDTREFGDQQNK